MEAEDAESLALLSKVHRSFKASNTPRSGWAATYDLSPRADTNPRQPLEPVRQRTYSPPPQATPDPSHPAPARTQAAAPENGEGAKIRDDHLILLTLFFTGRFISLHVLHIHVQSVY